MTLPRTPLPRAVAILVGMAALVIVIAGMSVAAWLIAPLVLALVIVIGLSPAPRWLRARGVPAWLTTTILVVLVYAVLALIVFVLVVSIARLAEILPGYSRQATEFVDHLARFLARFGVDRQQVHDALNGIDLDRLASFFGSLLDAVTGIGGGLVFLLSLLLFLSIDAASADDRFDIVAKDRPYIARSLTGFVRDTRQYLWVTTIFGFLIAVLDTVGLMFLDIPLPILWGVLSFITNYIPNIGFLLGVAPPALLGLLAGGWQLMLGVIVLYAVLNFLLQSVVQPRFVGDAVGLSGTTTFVSLILWSWVLGPLGAILAVPLTLLAKALLVDVDPRARWVHALVASGQRLRLDEEDDGGVRRGGG
ncbi:AI-2E family transporter [Actinokineospora enzanensis]|uniref:AI-2E family transporter n=1 Tax=Actinokineospora enzanensis TaxID=155975 RepID=UPI000526595C|nr:AI-2E family transporter [Actinokineospora enzanensis]